jgi:23S rRNA (adenine2503-C2)-methyltransferase
MGDRIDLLELSPDDLKDLLVEWGEPSYRAAQIDRWIYHRLSVDFDEMTDLPQSLRGRLTESTEIGTLTPLAEQPSRDGLTRKVLFELRDGRTLETVFMLYADAPDAAEWVHGKDVPSDSKRRTVCVSTQVGCPIGCPFCATGQAGFLRNLTAGEIVAQVLYFAREAKEAGQNSIPLTNIVLMGMGEPLMKFDITWRALESLTQSTRFALGARRITISTSGMIPGINRMAQMRSQVNLAVSLHAADDQLRDELVPINRRYPLGELINSCREYIERTHRRITFEYALIQGVNDEIEQARALAKLLSGLLCHLNLIPLNPTSNMDYQRSSYERVRGFERVMRESGISTTLRVEKGIEIGAGCGQLRQQLKRPDYEKLAALPTVA